MKIWRRGLVFVLAFAVAIAIAFVDRLPTVAQTELTLEAAGLSLEELGEGVYGLISSTDFPNEDPNIAICNAAIVIGEDGILVIDPFQNEDLANLAFSQAEELSDRPLLYVLNTHYHYDHTGGNAAATARDIPIVGRDPIREYMLERNGEQDPNVAPPQVVFNGEVSLWLGDREVKIETVEGHSGGTDLVAYIPDVDVLIAGDILFHQRFPYAADGNLDKWQESLDRLSEKYATSTILPGHGPVSDRAGLDTLNNYFDYLEYLAETWEAEGLNQEEAIASASQMPPAYNDYKFKALYENNLATAYQQWVADEMSESLTDPQEN